MTKRKRTSSSAIADRGTTWARDVVAGKVVAGPHVRNACRRHLDDLDRGHERGLVYSVEKAERVCRFFETKLRLNGGQFEGKPFLLHPSQAFKLSCLFGWLKLDGTRRFRRAFIEEGKGNGKSPFAAGVGLYGMMADDEAGAEIYAIAAHRDQAKILFNAGRLLGIKPANMVAFITELIDAGLIVRDIDPIARRAFTLTVTPHGAALLDACTQRLDSHEDELLTGFTDVEKATFLDFLNRVTRSAT